METDNKRSYISPLLEVVEFRTEQGFAQSNAPYENGGEFGWD